MGENTGKSTCYLKELWETMETSPCYCKTRKHMKKHHCIANIIIFLHGTYRKSSAEWEPVDGVQKMLVTNRGKHIDQTNPLGALCLSCNYCFLDVFGRIRTIADFS